MFRCISVLLTLIIINLNLAGCAGYVKFIQDIESSSRASAEKRYNELHERIAEAQDEKAKNERKKIVEHYLKYGPELSPDPYIQSLVGDYQGSTCNGKTKVAINISYIYSYPVGDPSPSALIVHGKIRLIDVHGGVVETYIKGRVKSGGKYKGPLTIESVKQPTFRDFIELVTGTNDRVNQLILDDAAKDGSLLDAYEKMFGSRKLEDRGPFGRPDMEMRMQLASNAEGNGWVGSFVADGFEDCHELVMKNTAGKSTAMFLPVNAWTAFGILADTHGLDIYSGPKELKNIKNKLYWYKVAEKYGFDKDAETKGYDNVLLNNALAETYMKLAEAEPKSSVQYYQQVREYYLKNATAIGDARAQNALVNIYRHGLGTPVNNKEADKWLALVRKTYAQAARTCTQPKTINTMYTLLDHELLRARRLGLLFYIFTSVDIDPGETKILMLSAANVITLDRPYQCVALGKRIGGKIDVSALPDYVEVGRDNIGRVYYIDKSFDKSMFTVGANILERIANELPVQPVFTIQPLGDNRFKINLKNSFEKDIELDLN